MSSASLERRVDALEKQVQRLLANAATAQRAKDWRQAIGLFPGDDLMKQIDAAGQAIREQDRRSARSRSTSRRPKK